MPKVFGIFQKVKVFAKLFFALFSHGLSMVAVSFDLRIPERHGIVMWKFVLKSNVKAKPVKESQSSSAVVSKMFKQHHINKYRHRRKDTG